MVTPRSAGRAWNVAVAVLTAGLLAGSTPLTAVGGIVIGGCVVIALALLVGSVPRGMGQPAQSEVRQAT